jgi:cellulose biosynthesis protein BcsQ
MKLKVISLISGKGGAGKTTVAISVAKLLADIGVKVLLIDFDISTNGASYFFRNQFAPNQKGIWELMAEGQVHQTPVVSAVRKLDQNFYFVASRTSLNQQGPTYDSIKYDVKYLREAILAPIIEYAKSFRFDSRSEGIIGFDYVLIDCQAGFSSSSIAACRVSDMAILISEADAISSDAADNLLIQMGTSLPQERRYLITKIDVRDAATYRQMKDVFQALNRLPPLPFDFAVRNAFGARQIPINVKEPSSLLFALFETIKFAFPELYPKIESYKRAHVDNLFDQYNEQMRKLISKREMLQHELVNVKRMDLARKRRFTVLFWIVITTVAGTVIYYSSRGNLTLTTVGMGTVTILAMWSAFRTMNDLLVSDSSASAETTRQIEKLTEEVDQFRSLLWARSKEYLIDSEIADKTSEMEARRKKLTTA